jgi:hypothetical protein
VKEKDWEVTNISSNIKLDDKIRLFLIQGIVRIPAVFGPGV